MSASVGVKVVGAGASWNAYQVSQAGGAFTPTANRELLAIGFLNEINGSYTGFSGHGTWSKMAGTAGASVLGVELWGCKVGGSPSSSAVTAGFTSGRGTFEIIELAADYSAATVAASLVQASSVSAGYHNGATSYTATLSAFADATNNACVYCLAIPDGTGGTTVTPGGSITEDSYTTTHNHDVFFGSMVGQNTSPSASSNSAYANHVYFAVELDYVGGGGGGGSSIAAISNYYRMLRSQ